MTNTDTKTKKIFGIDSLYYFCGSSENYDDLYLDILDQIEEVKGLFGKRDIEFENKDINININEIPLNFLGKAEGFHWFQDINSYFKIGFKDRFKNRGVNDIRVQLMGSGDKSPSLPVRFLPFLNCSKTSLKSNSILSSIVNP